jgi:hypothetical protein
VRQLKRFVLPHEVMVKDVISLTKKEKHKLRLEIARVQKALKELDPDGMFPP